MKPEIVSSGVTSPRGSDRKIGVVFYFASLASSGPQSSFSHPRRRPWSLVCKSGTPTPAAIPEWFASEVSGPVKTIEKPSAIHQRRSFEYQGSRQRPPSVTERCGPPRFSNCFTFDDGRDDGRDGSQPLCERTDMLATALLTHILRTLLAM